MTADVKPILLLPPPRRRSLPKTNDPFKLLGVSPRASLVKIKRAYRDLCREFHPDKNPDGRGEFERVNQAYRLIMSGDGIGRLIARCDIVPLKQEQAQIYANIERAMVLAGIKPYIPDFWEGRRIMAQMEDKAKDFAKFQGALSGRCPGCRYKEQCDIATGWGKVETVYREIQDAAMKRSMESFFGSFLGMFKSEKAK